jgi:GNAT superfamily N-acetyltransferase
LTLRIRPKAEGVEQYLGGDRSVKVVVRVEEGDREVGRAEMTMQVAKKFDPLTGETDHWRRARLDTITVPGKDDRQRGIESLMLKRAEDLAREHGAREVYDTLDSDDARPFFEQQGYQVRRAPQGGHKVLKSLVEPR